MSRSEVTYMAVYTCRCDVIAETVEALPDNCPRHGNPAYSDSRGMKVAEMPGALRNYIGGDSIVARPNPTEIR